jgi:hypothetical protein
MSDDGVFNIPPAPVPRRPFQMNREMYREEQPVADGPSSGLFKIPTVRRRGTITERFPAEHPVGHVPSGSRASIARDDSSLYVDPVLEPVSGRRKHPGRKPYR